MGMLLAGFITVVATVGMMVGATLLDMIHRPRPAPIVALVRDVEVQRSAVSNLRSYAEATRHLCGFNVRGEYQIPSELDHRYWVARHNRAVTAYQRVVLSWATGSQYAGIESVLPTPIIPCSF
ncbi:hypothetical protein HYW67_03210 [Candidatus Parcubacteria bacterium]|nr:hypothetical protein [Candidatus Parcubacteria bacterium]